MVTKLPNCGLEGVSKRRGGTILLLLSALTAGGSLLLIEVAEAKKAVLQSNWNPKMRSLSDIVDYCSQHPTKEDCKGSGDVEGYRWITYFESDKKDLLLIPTDQIAGLEANEPDKSPAVYIPDYWYYAILKGIEYSKTSTAPPYFDSKHWLVVAVNSASRRSRDQLHFHVCTLKSDAGSFVSALKASSAGDKWGTTMSFDGHVWNVIQNKTWQNPFKVVFNDNGAYGKAGEVGAYHGLKGALSIVVAIAPGRQSWYIAYNEPSIDKNGKLDDGFPGVEALFAPGCNAG